MLARSAVVGCGRSRRSCRVGRRRGRGRIVAAREDSGDRQDRTIRISPTPARPAISPSGRSSIRAARASPPGSVRSGGVAGAAVAVRQGGAPAPLARGSGSLGCLASGAISRRPCLDPLGQRRAPRGRPAGGGRRRRARSGRPGRAGSRSGRPRRRGRRRRSRSARRGRGRGPRPAATPSRPEMSS